MNSIVRLLISFLFMFWATTGLGQGMGNAPAPATETWLFDLPAVGVFCTVSSAGLLHISDGIRITFSGGPMNKRGLSIQQTDSLLNIADLSSPTDVTIQPFLFQLFLRLNGLDLSTPMPLDTDGIHLDCKAANILVLGPEAYP